MTSIDREPVQVVEIRQPLCQNDFGIAPCTATGTNDTKCYNTRATCQDTANFALGTPLSLYFTKGKVAEQNLAGDSTSSAFLDDSGGTLLDDSGGDLLDSGGGSSSQIYAIPSLVSVSTSPTRINLAGANPDAQGLGNRAVCRIEFRDHPHTDRVVDPYVDGRSWDPMSPDRGSFWSRWSVRNKYRQNIEIRVYEGYAGQSLTQMTRRTYFLAGLNGPDSSGRVVITGKDILARVEERRAQAPAASPGELFADISAAVTSFEVANAVEADYPASGTVRINDELMTYTGRSSSTNGITLTGVVRGTDGTTADAHVAEDAVQECLRYTDAAVDTVLNDLLTTYGGVPASWLDTAAWATEVGSYLTSYRLNTVVSEPTSVADLVSQVQIQALCYLWWDERVALVKLKAVRGIEEQPSTITAESHIIAGSFALTEFPRQRASRVWVFYGHRNYVDNIQEPDSYRYQFVVADLESETAELYGDPSIRKIYANWLSGGALAQNTASKIITRFVDVPSQVKFRMDAKDRAYWVGDSIYISHHLDVDQFGERRLRLWTIVAAEEVMPGEVVEYMAEDTTLYGRVHFVMDNAAADYPGYDVAPFKNCYIGDANGLLSDGEPAGRIS